MPPPEFIVLYLLVDTQLVMYKGFPYPALSITS